MTSKFIKCGKCGKVNPSTARICLDCNTILERRPLAEESLKEPSGKKTEDDGVSLVKPSTVEEFVAFFGEDEEAAPEEKAPIRRRDVPEQTDKEDDIGKMSGLEKFGVGYDDTEPDTNEIFEKSKAFEVDRHSLEEDEEKVALSSELESVEESFARRSKESEDFRREEGTEDLRTRPPVMEQPQEEPLRKRPPRHPSPWEKSDVEILTSLRRKRIARGFLTRVLPLFLAMILIILAGRYVLFPFLLPEGTWEGSLIDSSGDVLRFSIEVKRNGNVLRGFFWPVDNSGKIIEEYGGAKLPFILQGLHVRSPMGVVGQFTRRGIHLSVYQIEDLKSGKTLELEGELQGIGKAGGRAINYRKVQGTWTLVRRSMY